MNPNVTPWPQTQVPTNSPNACPCCEDIGLNADRTAHECALKGASHQASHALEQSRKHIDTKGMNLDFAVDLMTIFWMSTFRHWYKILQNQSQQQYLTSVYTKYYFHQNHICNQHAEYYKFS